MSKASLSEEQQHVVFQMSQVGVTQKKIATAFDISQPTVSNIIKTEKLRDEIRKRDLRMSNAIEKGAASYIKEKLSPNMLPNSK